MQILVNFIKLSSIYLASLSLGATTMGHTLPDQNRLGQKGIVPPKNVLMVSQIQGSQTQKSEEPESDSMSYSYLMDPTRNKTKTKTIEQQNTSLLEHKAEHQSTMTTSTQQTSLSTNASGLEAFSSLRTTPHQNQPITNTHLYSRNNHRDIHHQG
ncbi:hypothetical protein TEA_029750 [Camellia sinensis var. sinensis]|uniref:Uncharacterized protein n=1 Tax=Camellia sinensis var. sinensis TaxID=542762 RepID=A0A4S4EYF8_CAMSN|nr:hypothetical protein TEA_029750 [Camellia sinensis var. sinensis]